MLASRACTAHPCQAPGEGWSTRQQGIHGMYTAVRITMQQSRSCGPHSPAVGGHVQLHYVQGICACDADAVDVPGPQAHSAAPLSCKAPSLGWDGHHSTETPALLYSTPHASPRLAACRLHFLPFLPSVTQVHGFIAYVAGCPAPTTMPGHDQSKVNRWAGKGVSIASASNHNKHQRDSGAAQGKRRMCEYLGRVQSTLERAARVICWPKSERHWIVCQAKG